MFVTKELTSFEASCSLWKTEGVFFPVRFCSLSNMVQSWRCRAHYCLRLDDETSKIVKCHELGLSSATRADRADAPHLFFAIPVHQSGQHLDAAGRRIVRFEFGQRFRELFKLWEWRLLRVHSGAIAWAVFWSALEYPLFLGGYSMRVLNNTRRFSVIKIRC